MCEPTTIMMGVGLAMSAVSMKMQADEAADNVQMQMDAEAEQKAYNTRVALENAKDQQAAAARKLESIKEGAARDSIDAQKTKIQQVGQVMTQAAAGGVTGLSIDQSVIGVYRAEEDVRNNIAINSGNQIQDVNAQLLNVEKNLRTGLSAPGTTVIQPSSGAAMFQFGAQAMNTGAKMYDRLDSKGTFDKTPDVKQGG